MKIFASAEIHLNPAKRDITFLSRTCVTERYHTAPAVYHILLRRSRIYNIAPAIYHLYIRLSRLAQHGKSPLSFSRSLIVYTGVAPNTKKCCKIGQYILFTACVYKSPFYTYIIAQNAPSVKRKTHEISQFTFC